MEGKNGGEKPQIIAQPGKDHIPENTLFTGFVVLKNHINLCLGTNIGSFCSSYHIDEYIDTTGTESTPNAPNSWYLIS